jgi:hypothetical protein
MLSSPAKAGEVASECEPEGAPASRLFFDAEAPTTALRAVPLPRFRGGGKKWRRP